MTTTLSRKRFLQMLAAAGVGGGLASISGGLTLPRVYAQTTNLTTLALVPGFRRRSGPPLLFGATGLALTAHRFAAEAIGTLPLQNAPQSGPYLTCVMFGGIVQQAVYRQATIELQLSQAGTGLHVFQLFLGDIYPYPYFDAAPVTGTRIAPTGQQYQRVLPRFQTVQMPDATIRIVATFGGAQVSFFDLELPDAHTK